MKTLSVVGLAVVLFVGKRLTDLVQKIRFQKLIRELKTYILKNEAGVEVHISPVGCAIVKLLVPDRNGVLDDIVLGYEDNLSYADNNSSYFGVIVGRFANRIKNAEFGLDGKHYKLAPNSGDNTLHGGEVGWGRKIWTVESVTQNSIELSLISPDDDEGYPGEVSARVRYELVDEANSCQLKVHMEATTDAPTIINMAQHSYFNLAGHKSGDVLDHEIQILGEHYTPKIDDIPTGAIESVEGTPFDLTEPTAIGAHIDEVPGGYDHNYVLHNAGRQAKFVTKANGKAQDTPRLVAVVRESTSGRRMAIKTTAPGLQFYSGNFLDGVEGKDGAVYQKHAGFALETQNFPDAINEEKFPSPVLRPGTTYLHETHFQFFH